MGCAKFNNIKDTCSKSFAICSEYNGALSAYTELDPDNCNSVEEVIEDLTVIIDGIKDSLNFEDLRGECITYPVGELTPLQVFQAMQDVICSQNTLITTMQGQITTLQTQVAALQTNICP